MGVIHFSASSISGTSSTTAVVGAAAALSSFLASFLGASLEKKRAAVVVELRVIMFRNLLALLNMLIIICMMK